MRKILSIAIAFMLAWPAHSVVKPKYRNPTGKEFPILAWYSVLGDDVTPERYRELRNAGFNISFSHFKTAAEVEKALKACRGTGVKLMVTCGELEKNTEATVKRFKGDRSVAGWFLRDEPRTDGYPALREFRDRIYSADKSHIGYLNLLPCFVSADDLKAKSYEDYVQRFVDEVGLPLISYDLYPVVENNYKAELRPEFFENLETVRKVSLRSGCPFWAFCLSTAHNPYPIPTDTHLRVEAFCALAYGAQCIQYFTYTNPDTTVWNFHNAPIDASGKRTGVYYRIKNLNRIIQNLAPVFLGATVTDVSHIGKVLPKGTKPLGTLPMNFLSLRCDGESALVSQISNGKHRYVMIVNTSLDKPQGVSFHLENPAARITTEGKEEQVMFGHHYTMMYPGSYVLYRMK
jgi:hypothetical protein